MAHVGELVRDHDPDLVAGVAIEQRVEQHHPLGRPEAGHVGVGGGRAAAGVDLVDLAHARRRRRSASSSTSARVCALGQRREVVEHRVEHDRRERRERGARRRTEPAAAGSHQPLGSGASTATAPARRRRRPARAPIAVDLARSPAQPPHDCVTSPTAIARRRESTASGSVGSVPATARPAPVSAPAATGRGSRAGSAAGSVPHRERRAPPGRPPTGPAPIASWGRANARAAAISAGLKYVSQVDRGGLDRPLARGQQPRAELGRGQRAEQRRGRAVARVVPHQRDCSHRCGSPSCPTSTATGTPSRR